MGLKQELLRQADEELAALEHVLSGLSDAELTHVWLGSWSVREMLIHISGWHREMIPALERMAQGQRPLPEGVSYDDLDAWNAKFVEAKRGVSVREILAELHASHRDLLRAAEQVPDDRFAPGKTATRIVDMIGPHHYREHGQQISAWRQRGGI